MKLIILESPYAGDIARNEEYARRAMLHSLMKGEYPFVTHLLYTQVYDDTIPHMRLQGLDAGDAWRRVADITVFYTDYGMSGGMERAIEYCLKHKTPYEIRMIGVNNA